MSFAIDPVIALPEEVSLQIFSYLEKSDLASCCEVNKGWRRLASDNELWAPIARQMFNGEDLKVPNIKASLQVFESKKLKSNEEILDRLQAFINRISLDNNARFRCIITTGSRYQAISVEFKGTQDEIAPQMLPANTNNLTDFNFKDDCIATNGIGDGSLVAYQPPEHLPKACRTYTLFGIREHIHVFTPNDGPFQAVLRFPDPHMIGLEHQTDMEHRIMNMVQVKLDKLAGQVSRKNSIMYTTAIGVGVVALGAYFLNLYLTSVNSDQ